MRKVVIGDNEHMRHFHKLLFWQVMIAFVLSSCGAIEWPLPRVRPQDSNKPIASIPRVFNAKSSLSKDVIYASRGDTVYALSRRHQVSVREIIEANQLLPPFHLQVGQRVILPRIRYHVVHRGETFYGIAKQFRVNPYDLARANNLNPPYKIITDQRLILPRRSLEKTRNLENSLFKYPSKSSGISRKSNIPPSAVDRPSALSNKGFAWPVKGKVISNFGAKAKGMRNDGINIASRRGSSVVASENGTVVYAGNELRGFGNLLLIKHSGGWVTAYAHIEKVLVKRGMKVTKGQLIATVGSTGNVKKPQLHFEMRRGRIARDPRKYLQGV